MWKWVGSGRTGTMDMRCHSIGCISQQPGGCSNKATATANKFEFEPLEHGNARTFFAHAQMPLQRSRTYTWLDWNNKYWLSVSLLGLSPINCHATTSTAASWPHTNTNLQISLFVSMKYRVDERLTDPATGQCDYAVFTIKMLLS